MRTRVAVALVAALATGGCGAAQTAKNAVDPVAQAADASIDTSGVQVEMHGSGKAEGVPIDMRATGAFATHGLAGTMASTVHAAGQDIAMDMRLVGSTIYMRSPAFKQGLGSDKWIKIDLRKALKGHGIDLNALSNLGGGNDPSEPLRMLRNMSGSHKVGSETIHGVATTHYAGTVDIDRLAQRGDATVRASVARLRRLTGASFSNLPFDVWIDGDHRIRRIAQRTPVGPGATMAMTIDYVRYGVKVVVRRPPAGEVKDLTDLAGRASGSS